VNKAFTKETDNEDDQDSTPAQLPASAGGKNYITPQGYAGLRSELLKLIDEERPSVVETVSWAAKNGDRSENGDYIYGKRRLRQIDSRIRFLTKRLEIAQVIDPSVHHGKTEVFFGATVTYADEQGQEHTITIKGIDEAQSNLGEVSWISPIAKKLLRSHIGDAFRLATPGGVRDIEVIDVRYPAPEKL
jgi:transcription elongation factor GreB